MLFDQAVLKEESPDVNSSSAVSRRVDEQRPDRNPAAIANRAHRAEQPACSRFIKLHFQYFIRALVAEDVFARREPHLAYRYADLCDEEVRVFAFGSIACGYDRDAC